MEDKQIRKLIAVCEDIYQEGDNITCLYFCRVYADADQDDELDRRLF